MMTPERLNEIASKPLVEITQREFDCVAIAAREGLEAQEQLKPRNGHTFESLQKMWEDTHIELAKTISERNEAKVELGAYKAIIDRAFEAMKDHCTPMKTLTWRSSASLKSETRHGTNSTPPRSESWR